MEKEIENEEEKKIGKSIGKQGYQIAAGKQIEQK
jgi:hypothetical protein